jgi:hypothetical protein
MSDQKSGTMDEGREIQKELAEPFDPKKIGWKAQALSKDKTKCLAVAYIDARDVMDRLDAVFGVMGWQDDYEFHADGSVLCALSCLYGLPGMAELRWVTKCDVGSPSEQPDKGDVKKAAVSDALKRAAVKFGIGRYLYALDGQWVAYDDKARKPAATPALPEWALPHEMRKPARATPPKKEGAATVASPDQAARLDKAKEVLKEAEKKPVPGPQTQEDWLDLWEVNLTACETPERLNEVLPGFAKIPQGFKQGVWDLVKEFANERQWVYDATEKKFTATRPVVKGGKEQAAKKK